uniref:VWFA domain-containing protein n=1 Tax=Arion vulgaris TaxID=1028688 RepID=A0A0B6ZY83_9EUPU
MIRKLVELTCVLMLTSLVLPVKTCSPGAEFNIFFIVDSSRTTGEANYPTYFSFVSEVVTLLPVGVDGIAVGLVTHDTNPPTVIALTKDADAFIKKIKKIEYRQNTVQLAVNLYTTLRNVPVADTVNTIFVLLTDNTDSKLVKGAINMSGTVKKSGVHIITVGVTNKVNEDELRKVASNSDESVFVKTFSDLRSYVNPIADLICKVAEAELLENVTNR